MEKYQVGDTVISNDRYHGYKKHEVVRVTKTQAILDNDTKLRIEVSTGACRAIGDAGGYGARLYYKSTPKLEADYKRDYQIRFIQNKIHGIDFRKFDDQSIERFYDFMKSLPTK